MLAKQIYNVKYRMNVKTQVSHLIIDSFIICIQIISIIITTKTTRICESTLQYLLLCCKHTVFVKKVAKKHRLFVSFIVSNFITFWNHWWNLSSGWLSAMLFIQNFCSQLHLFPSQQERIIDMKQSNRYNFKAYLSNQSKFRKI